MKKLISTVLTFALILSLMTGLFTFPVSAATATASGTCGDNLTWTLDDEGTLTISGTGEMKDCIGDVFDFWDPDGLYYMVMGNLPSSCAPWFDYRTTISRIIIEEGVTGIGKGAFFSCGNLVDVTIADSVIEIGDYAFYESGLESIIIPENVTNIGKMAFAHCNKLTSVTILGRLTNIGLAVFECCVALESIEVASNNSVYKSVGNCLIDTETKTLIVGCNNSVIPSDGSVTRIGHGAFAARRQLENIIIPDSITVIGDAAFSHCTGLTDITIPDSVTSIDDHAFYDCTGLTSIAIPDSVTSIDSYAFYGCTGLTSITIPDSVTSIGDRAFYGCENLKTIYGVPGSYAETYAKQNGYAFLPMNCGDNLTWTLDDDGTLTISGTGAMSDWTFSSPAPWNTYCSSIKTVQIGNSVTSIGDNAFSGCAGLTSITIPDSVTSIGKCSFSGCSGLTSITIPDSVTSIGSYAFSDCTGLTSITIPDSVTSIGNGAFYNCNGLKSATISDNVTSIVSEMFAECHNLTSITIPNRVTTIDSSAFAFCYELKNVTFSANVTTIGDAAFTGCTGLTSIAIPDSVTSIGGYAFSGTGLTRITIPASVTSIGVDAFSGCGDLTICGTPGSYAETYANQNEILFLPTNVPAYYDISYNANGGSGAPTAQTKTYGVSLTLSRVLPTRPCYSFAGWATTPDATTPEYTSGAVYSAEADLTLYAVWRVPHGTCGQNLTWTLHDDGTLEILGTGAMTDYSAGSAPWYAYRTQITSLALPHGLTKVGNYAFYGCVALGDLSTIINPPVLPAVPTVSFSETVSCPAAEVVITKADGTTVALNKDSKTTEGATYDPTTGKLTIEGLNAKKITAASGDVIVEVKGTNSLTNDEDVTAENKDDPKGDDGKAAIRVPGKLYFVGDGKLTVTAKGYNIYSETAITFTDKVNVEVVSNGTVVNAAPIYTPINSKTDDCVITFSGKAKVTGTTEVGPVIRQGASPWAYGKLILKDDAELNMTVKNCAGWNAAAFVTHWEISGGTMNVDVTGKDVIQAVSGIEAYAERTTREDRSSTLKMTGGTVNIKVLAPITARAGRPHGIFGLYASGMEFTGGTLNLDVKAANTPTNSGAICVMWNNTTDKLPEDKFVTIHVGGDAVINAMDCNSDGLFTTSNANGAAKIAVVIDGGTIKGSDNAFVYDRNAAKSTLEIKGGTIDWTSKTKNLKGATGTAAKTVTFLEGGVGPDETVIKTGTSSEDGGSPYDYYITLMIPVTVTEIGQYAFSGCTALREVVLPVGCTSVGAYAFQNCTNLAKIVIPQTVTSIDTNALSGCSTAVTTVYGVAGTAAQTFANNKGFPFVPLQSGDYYYKENGDGTVTVTGYAGTDTRLVLPAALEGMPVSGIGANAFKNNTSLSVVVLPEGMKTVEAGAFYGCTGLKGITLPSTLEQIDANAFYNCRALTALTLPDGLKTVGASAFRYCYGLTEVTIPASVTSIGDYAFANGNLRTVYGYCETAAETYARGNGFTFVDLLSGNVMYHDNGDGTVTVTGYTGTGTTLDLPGEIGGKPVVAIGANAFKGNTRLTAVTVPENVASIGANAFDGCTSLRTVSLPESLRTVAEEAFSDCSSLTELVLPEGLQAVGDFAFCYCTNLQQVTIPRTVTQIGNYAFEGCSKMTTVYGMTETYAETYAGENGYTFIPLNPKVITVTVETLPNKTVYRTGETFSSAGLTLRVTYTDGTSKVVSDGYTLSSPDLTSAGTRSVSVTATYEEHSAEFTLTVLDPNDTQTPQIVLRDLTARAGDTVNMVMEVKNAAQLKSFAAYEFTYDHAALELLNVQCSRNDAAIFDWNADAGEVFLTFTANVVPEDALLTLTFRVKENAGGDYRIGFDAIAQYEAENGNETAYDAVLVPGMLSVPQFQRGDVNGDGKVNSNDAVYLLRHTLLPARYPVNQNDDMNGDGIVNSADAIYLLRHTLLPARYPLH